MKILNIISEEAYQTIHKDIKSNKELPIKHNTKRDKDTIESGVFSKVNNDKNDPFTVNKHSKEQRSNYYSKKPVDVKSQDGYWDYIENISKNDELKSNPFLPRIYAIRSLKDDHGNRKLSANIERLVNAVQIENEDPDMLADYISTIVDTDSTPKSFNLTLIEYLAKILQIAAARGNYTNIKNDQLKEALAFIHEMSEFFWLDIHSGNIMFRRTKYGIQLVITDPLAGNKI